MNVSALVPQAGRLTLLVGPRRMNSTLLNFIAHLAEREPLRVLDGGNRFNVYTVARAARGRTEVLERITISRAFTCYQVLSLLEGTPAIPVLFVVLDLLSTFYDESVQIGERKQLLRACVMHLQRLVRVAGGIVSVHPPAVPSLAAIQLLEMLQSPTVETYFIQTATPPPAQERLL